MSMPFKPDKNREESLEIKVSNLCEADGQHREEGDDDRPGASDSAASPQVCPQDVHTSKEVADSKNPPCDSVDITEQEDERPSLPPLELKKRKGLPLIIVLFSLPLLAAGISLVADPASWPYFQAKYVHSISDKKIADYTAALTVRPDLDIMEDRAAAYHTMGRWEEEREDLQKLLDSGFKHGRVYSALAKNIIERQGVTKEALDLLRQAVHQSLADYRACPDGGRSTLWGLYEDAYMLLCQGDTEAALEACQNIPDQLYHQRRDYLKALALREKAETAQSLEILHQLQGAGAFGGYIEAKYFYAEALLDLDQSKTEAAILAYAKGEKLHKFKQSYGLKALVRGWIDYQHGHYSRVIEDTDRQNISSQDKFSTDYDKPGNPVGAALHMLRAHAFMKQSKTGDAEKELADYEKLKSSGQIFTPKPYRDWYRETGSIQEK